MIGAAGRMRARQWLLMVTLAGALGALTRPVAATIAAELPAQPPCQARPLVTRPTEFRLQPGLARHQNWLEAAVPEPDATDFVLCVDGRSLGTQVGETPVAGRVRISVPTTWVDLQWLGGRLDDFLTPARWEVRYTTYSLEADRRRRRATGRVGRRGPTGLPTRRAQDSLGVWT